jgi:hypothetical protein
VLLVDGVDFRYQAFGYRLQSAGGAVTAEGA